MVQVAKLSSAELEAVGSMLAAIDPFVKLRNTMPLRCVQAFLLVAYNEGLSVGEYAATAKMSASTMSRNLLDIGDRDRHMEDGLGLVIGREKPENRREKEYFLSPKGRAVARKLTEQFK